MPDNSRMGHSPISYTIPRWVEGVSEEPVTPWILSDIRQRRTDMRNNYPRRYRHGRARYLSFLCWAMDKTGNDSASIDRWEVALALGEHFRHGSDDKCGFLGSRLIKSRNPARGDSTPRQLHVQTARVLYKGLLRSCGLVDGQAQSLSRQVGSWPNDLRPAACPDGCRGALSIAIRCHAFPKPALWSSATFVARSWKIPNRLCAGRERIRRPVQECCVRAKKM